MLVSKYIIAHSIWTLKGSFFDIVMS